MEIPEVELRPCPLCDGTTLLVHTPRGAAIWCPECGEVLAEASYEGRFSAEKSDMVATELAEIWKMD